MYCLIAQALDTAQVFDEIRKADKTGTIWLLVLVITVFFCGMVYLLRYMLTHTQKIHEESNKTLLDISSKHETRCSLLTEAFVTECAELRDANAKTMLDARDMVHAARDLAQHAVSQAQLLEEYRRKEEEVRLRSERK
jgi:hypothetical protein